MRQRLHMWEATIRSCLLYGIECLPLTPALRHDLNKFAMKHVRAITANQSHLTHTTDQELLQMFAMPSLDDCLSNAITRVTQALSAITFTCVAKWGDTCRQAFAAACSNIAALDRQFDPRACPVCGIYFDSRRAVKVHIARAHASRVEDTTVDPSTIVSCEGSQTLREVAVTTQSVQSSSHDPTKPPFSEVRFDADQSSEQRAQPAHASECEDESITPAHGLTQAVVAGGTPVEARVSALVGVDASSPIDHRVFDKAIHSRDGLPTCAACGKHFGRWSGLRKHIVKGYCTVLHSITPAGPPEVVHTFVPIALRPSVREVVLRRGISGMFIFPEVMKEMLYRGVCYATSGSLAA